jgi:hypothetical protein
LPSGSWHPAPGFPSRRQAHKPFASWRRCPPPSYSSVPKSDHRSRGAPGVAEQSACVGMFDGSPVTQSRTSKRSLYARPGPSPMDPGELNSAGIHLHGCAGEASRGLHRPAVALSADRCSACPLPLSGRRPARSRQPVLSGRGLLPSRRSVLSGRPLLPSRRAAAGGAPATAGGSTVNRLAYEAYCTNSITCPSGSWQKTCSIPRERLPPSWNGMAC